MDEQLLYTGDDLLSIFNTLHINLLNTNPNTIKAWFDTDDKNMKNLLQWMCTSLSEKNYISSLDLTEFERLDEPLSGKEYEKEVEKLQKQYPGVFCVEDTELYIELLEDEKQSYLERLKELDEVISINESLQFDLSKELNSLASLETKTAAQIKLTQDRCKQLALDLDLIHTDIDSNLTKYGQCLYDFEFGPHPKWINNIDIHSCKENLNLISSAVTPLLNRPEREMSMFLESTTFSDISARDMQYENLKQRICSSQLNHTVTAAEIETHNKIMEHLQELNADSLMLRDIEEIQTSIYEKNERKKVLCVMLQNVLMQAAEEQVSSSKLRIKERELKSLQMQLKTFNVIEETTLRLLSLYYLLSIMCLSEKDDINFSDKYYRDVIVLTSDLKNCAARTEKMEEIIKEYDSQSPEEKFKLVKLIMTIVFGNDCDLKEALETISQFRMNLDYLKNKLFCIDFRDERMSTFELENNISTLHSFFASGPTHRIVIWPSELQEAVSQVAKYMKEQQKRLKNAVEIISSKRTLDKWENHRRLLWVYFYSNQQKLKHVIEEIQAEKVKVVPDKGSL